ncbi:MAG: amino acid adenylation domain-containing protein [Gammaproteobacteria bacterium]|nr:amino acid adenylation domain-containing protein [Gammaproteobacteria bacterium]MBT5825666.1 amino acid adenylation domain-containing protein [Gammaproteobacteria bacterium]MBT6576953.1 amino acid adenylation domain-containing protein [Gammaproteobacteria bacterium]MBT7435747.1 amino acid adenylation domain-containing protein [Gammaproteobacteria bacterium]
MNIVIPFFQQCNQTPDKTAFVEEEHTISYIDLKTRIEKIAAFLRIKQVQNQCIAIALDRGIEAASSIYAVLSAGAIYLPLDIKNPVKRINFIIADAQPAFIIGIGDAPDWLDNPAIWLDLSQLPLTEIKGIFPVLVDKNNLAAILYTSGSTGNPKGVALSHQALMNFSSWAQTTFKLNQLERIASLAPFHFDLSIFDLFSSLASGATVYFLPARLSLSPSRLTAWLSEYKITTWYTVPSLLSFIALKGALQTTDLSHLKRLLFAGEVFPCPHLIKLADLLPDTELFNLYGPTETNVCCYWQVEHHRLTVEQNIPIGYAACDAALLIDTETGELLVNSLNNFSGYWQQGKLQPLSTNYYPTGDKVALNTQGEYEYYGRLDRMLKCSGYRVEPAEIEQCINQLATIVSCAVVGIKDLTSGQRPVAAVVLTGDATLSDIIKPLRQQLAPYMQPCKFIVLDTLPRLANGKTNYQAIQRLFES